MVEEEGQKVVDMDQVYAGNVVYDINYEEPQEENEKDDLKKKKKEK